MLYEDRLYGFAVAAMPLVDWETAEWTDAGDDETRAFRAMAIAVAMEAAFSATLKARRDAAEQAAKIARENAAKAAAQCEWEGCCAAATVRRVGRGGTPAMVCATCEAKGESLGYWLSKAAP